MKTKNLLYAIALPTLFAACTAEDVVTENNAALNDDLSSRFVVENVTLGLGDAETRAAKGEGYNQIVYTAGDRVGALLVDRLTGTSTSDYIANYTLMANSFNTNYIFETEDGANFASEAYMVEGNYVFYFPYNEQRTRSSVWAKLPKTQKLTLQADGTYSSFADVLAKSEAAGAPMLVGYDFINRADADKTIAAAMKQIYATPEITIVNSYTIDHDNNATTAEVAAPVTIQEIVLKKATGFVLNAPLKFSANGTTAWGEAAKTATNKSIVNVLFNETLKNNNYQAGAWVPAQIDPTVARYTSDVIDGTQATGAADTATEIILTLDEPITIAAEGSLTIYPVLPAEAYTGANVLSVKVINEAGLSNPYVDFGNASLYQGRRYPAQEYTGSVVNDDVKGSTLTAYIADYTQLEGVRVATVDELISAIKNAPAATSGAPTHKIRLAGDAVFNTRVASLVNSASNYTKASTIEFVNEVPMEGTFTLAPTKNLLFSEGAKLNASANVTLKSANIEIATGKNLTVASTATLTYEVATMTGATIVNNGTMTVKGDVDATVKNYGTMNVTGADLALATVENGKADGTSAGTINVAAPAALGNEAAVADLKNYANSTINNLGTISADAFLNNGKVVNGSETNFAATITAATAGTNATASYDGAPTATIENYAVVDIHTNNATINMNNVNANAIVGNGNGTIVNDVLAAVDNQGANKVTYTITGTINASTLNTANLATNSINKVIMKNVNLSVRSSNVSLVGVNIEFQGNNVISTTLGANGAASLVFGIDASTQAALYVANGKLTINSGVAFNGKYTLTKHTDAAIVNHANVDLSK